MNVDTSNDRDFWLVKVPKYLASSWKTAEANAELGKVRLPKDGIGPIRFITDSKLKQKLESEKNIKLPEEHELSLRPLDSQKMVIVGRTRDQSQATPGNTSSDNTSYEGQVSQRGEIRPVAGNSYFGLKSSSIREASKPTRTTQVLEKAVSSYKPRGAAQLAQEADLRRKKEEQRKMVREDKDVVQGRLFTAFEKQQYYNIKDLVRITNQSIPYLKEILKELCNYCASGTHKNMWELKPEYRHYKTASGSKPIVNNP